MNNPVKQRLRDGSVSLGSWIQIGHPGVAEVLSASGFDWIALDCEHGSMGTGEMAATLRGMHGRGAMPMVRVRENAVMAIRQPLDAGATGVFVPLVNTAEDARRAVAAGYNLIALGMDTVFLADAADQVLATARELCDD